MKNNHPSLNVKYKLMPLHLDHTLFNAFISPLLTAPNHPVEAATNAIILHQYRELIDQLKQLPQEQFKELIDSIQGSIEICVNLQLIQENLSKLLSKNQLKELHAEQCKWLIEFGASNRMIQSICFSLDDLAIKKARLLLNIPVCLGRRKTPSLEDKQSILCSWTDLTSEWTDEFLCYKVLHSQYPSYNLGQLYSVIKEGQ